ncbi:hypothetical protein AAMO2058_000971500 [Amorphochlora amoebiformis]
MGANKGKLALKNSLPIIAKEGKVSPATLKTIFDAYAPTGFMTPGNLQRLFRDIVTIQKAGAQSIYDKGLRVFKSTPEYKNLGFIERSAMNLSISTMKTTIFTAFSVAMRLYTNLENIRPIHQSYTKAGPMTAEVFTKIGPEMIFLELGKRNLIVASNIFDALNKR